MIRDDRRAKLIILIILLAAFLFGYARCQNPFLSRGKAVSEGFEDVRCIEISAQTGDVEVQAEGRSDVFVVSNGIEQTCSSGILQIRGWNEDIRLKVPETMLDRITIRTSTGDIRMDFVSANMVSAGSSTGNIRITGGSAESMECSNFSGGITLAGTGCTSIKVDNTSGGTVIEDGCVKNVEIGTISGEISITVPEAGNITVDTISADANVKVKEKPYLLSMDTVSGNVEVFGKTAASSKTVDPVLFLTFESVSGDLTVSAY